MQSSWIRYFILFFLLFDSITIFAQISRLVLPVGHTKKVNFALFSHDGMRLVTVSDDKTAKIWDVASGSIIADLKGYKDNITSAQFSPAGKLIVTSSDDSNAKIWNAVSGELLFDIKGHTDYVTFARFSPNGSRQEPQMITTTNFNIGVVGEELMKKIVLPQEKALFTHCNFQNADENISADDLGLNWLTNLQLTDISERGSNAAIAYMGATGSPDAFTLSGRYTV